MNTRRNGLTELDLRKHMHMTTSLTVLASGACIEAPFIDVLLHIRVIYEWDRGPGSNEQILSGERASH